MRRLDTRVEAHVTRMRRMLVVVMVAVSVGAVMSPRPAEAEAPDRTVTTTGYAEARVTARATDAARRAAYGTALERALASARFKAAWLAERVGGRIGPVTSVVEQSDGGIAVCDPPAGRERSLAPRPGRRGGRPRMRQRCYVVAIVSVTHAIR